MYFYRDIYVQINIYNMTIHKGMVYQFIETKSGRRGLMRTKWNLYVISKTSCKYRMNAAPSVVCSWKSLGNVIVCISQFANSHVVTAPTSAFQGDETSGMLLYCSWKCHFQKIVLEVFLNSTRKTLPCHRKAFPCSKCAFNQHYGNYSSTRNASPLVLWQELCLG